MDARKERGVQLAQRGHITKHANGWKVLSQTGNGSYFVHLEGSPSCTCPDFEIRQQPCKHIHAVECLIVWSTITEGGQTITTKTKTVRITYKQNWPAYNAAQTEEKERFIVLLNALCELVDQPPQRNGRPRLPLSDMIFACVYKIYCCFSSRRFMSDLREAQAKERIHKAPHFNSVSNYLADPHLTEIFTSLVTLSSLPLKGIENNFAVDSSGFSTCRFVRWFNKKYGREIDNREWVKVHLMCGVDTKIVTSVEVSGWAANDSPYFVPLLERTAKYFQMQEVSADKEYLSHRNLEATSKAQALPFIPFKVNTAVPKKNTIWSEMYHYFMYNRDDFLAHYHKRSNVETAFSMIKSKFGDAVRSKSDIGQLNEVLCKVLCHNLCVLIQAIHELGIEPKFYRGNAVTNGAYLAVENSHKMSPLFNQQSIEIKGIIVYKFFQLDIFYCSLHYCLHGTSQYVPSWCGACMSTSTPTRASRVVVRALTFDHHAYTLLREMASTTKSYGQFLSALILAEHARRQERQQYVRSSQLVSKEGGEV